MEKYSSGDDKRETLLRLTVLGKTYQDRYVTKYHAEWAQNFTNITDEQVRTAIAVIAELQRTMPGRGGNER